MDAGEHLNCRFYENQYPALEETVIVNVTEIAEMGAYVTLLEYNNIEVCVSWIQGKVYCVYRIALCCAASRLNSFGMISTDLY